MRAFAACALVLVGGAFAIAPAAAAEFYVGEPVVKDDLQLSPAYLTGIEMDRMPPGGAMMMGDSAHFEIDVHAGEKETHGFPPDAWIPYLTIIATIEQPGTDFKETEQLFPMTAGDGPHYANNFKMNGNGKYRITYFIEPPSVNGFIRHTDKETGVPEWWQPITVSWDFVYPSKTK